MNEYAFAIHPSPHSHTLWRTFDFPVSCLHAECNAHTTCVCRPTGHHMDNNSNLFGVCANLKTPETNFIFVRTGSSTKSSSRLHLLGLDSNGCSCMTIYQRSKGAHSSPVILLKYDVLTYWNADRSGRPRGLRHELSSPARTPRAWVPIPFEAWLSVCTYSVCVLCVNSGLATGWSPVQGVLSSV
jgi:hypothetical protein